MSNRSLFFLPKQELRVQTDATGSRSIMGSIPYNKPSEGLPFVEVIKPGAFRSALKQGADVLLLRDHNVANLMGRTTAGTLVLTDTPTALNFRCTLPSTTQAADLIESMQRGDLNGVSFGMVVTKDEWSEVGRKALRSISALDCHEISVCSFAAYPDASASLRSVPKALRALVTRSANDDDDDDDDEDHEDCDCERDADGRKIDPNCHCDDDEDSDEDDDDASGENRTQRLTWAERVSLKLDVLRRL